MPPDMWNQEQVEKILRALLANRSCGEIDFFFSAFRGYVAQVRFEVFAIGYRESIEYSPAEVCGPAANRRGIQPAEPGKCRGERNAEPIPNGSLSLQAERPRLSHVLDLNGIAGFIFNPICHQDSFLAVSAAVEELGP
jgi:hypothetical protein